MQPHQRRVVDEQKELADRLLKLRLFIGDGLDNASPIFAALAPQEQARLIVQAHYMTGYNDVLKSRIAHFDPQEG
jgi:hypothetical protein